MLATHLSGTAEPGRQQAGSYNDQRNTLKRTRDHAPLSANAVSVCSPGSPKSWTNGDRTAGLADQAPVEQPADASLRCPVRAATTSADARCPARAPASPRSARPSMRNSSRHRDRRPRNQMPTAAVAPPGASPPTARATPAPAIAPVVARTARAARCIRPTGASRCAHRLRSVRHRRSTDAHRARPALAGPTRPASTPACACDTAAAPADRAAVRVASTLRHWRHLAGGGSGAESPRWRRQAVDRPRTTTAMPSPRRTGPATACRRAADPDADRVAARAAQRPGIAEAVAGAGLPRDSRRGRADRMCRQRCQAVDWPRGSRARSRPRPATAARRSRRGASGV